MLNHYRLSASIDIPPTLKESEYYQECLKTDSVFNCKFMGYKEYRHQVDMRFKEPYRCPKKTSNQCISYGTYKSYLSLKSMQQYSKEWYE
jgi:hypothetical protein